LIATPFSRILRSAASAIARRRQAVTGFRDHRPIALPISNSAVTVAEMNGATANHRICGSSRMIRKNAGTCATKAAITQPSVFASTLRTILDPTAAHN
jgi:hypothetical protein